MSDEVFSASETQRRGLRPWTVIAILATLLCLLALPLVPRAVEFVEARYGPYRNVASLCTVCGREHVETSRSGRRTGERIEENGCSRWVDGIVDPGHSHRWVPFSESGRSDWFGSEGGEATDTFSVQLIYGQRPTIGDQRARELVLQFHELLEDGTLNPNDESMYEFFVNERIIEK